MKKEEVLLNDDEFKEITLERKYEILINVDNDPRNSNKYVNSLIEKKFLSYIITYCNNTYNNTYNKTLYDNNINIAWYYLINHIKFKIREEKLQKIIDMI